MTPPLARGGGSQARQQMRHRMRVLRPSDAPEDEYGGPVHDPTPAEHYAALPCLAWSPTDVREVLDEDAAATFGGVRINVPLDTDITEGDSIGSIVDRLGRPVYPDPMVITAVTPMGQHLAVMARLQRGGR